MSLELRFASSQGVGLLISWILPMFLSADSAVVFGRAWAGMLSIEGASSFSRRRKNFLRIAYLLLLGIFLSEIFLEPPCELIAL